MNTRRAAGLALALALASAGAASAAPSASGTELEENHAVLAAIDEATGRTKWTASSAGSPRYFSDAHEAQGVVVVEEWECDAFDAPVGLVLRGAHREAFVAFDSETGEELWRKRSSRLDGHEADGPGVAGSGKPFVVTQSGRLQGIDPRTGSVVWTHELGSRPLIAGNTGVVLIGPRRPADGSMAGGAAVIAVDREDGETRWTYRPRAGAVVQSWQGVLGVRQVVLTEAIPSGFGSVVRVFDVADGSELWQLEVGPTYRGLALAASILAIGGDDGVRGYDAGTGELRWYVPGRAFVSAASPRGPILLVPEEGTHTVAIDPETGSALWDSPVVPGFGSNRSSVLASTPIFIRRPGSSENEPTKPAGGHEFVLLDATTGADRWRRPRGPVDEWAPREEDKAGLVGATNVYLYGGCQWSS